MLTPKLKSSQYNPLSQGAVCSIICIFHININSRVNIYLLLFLIPFLKSSSISLRLLHSKNLPLICHPSVFSSFSHSHLCAISASNIRNSRDDRKLLPTSFSSNPILLMLKASCIGFTCSKSTLGVAILKILSSGHPPYLHEYANLLSHCDPVISFSQLSVV